MQVVTGVFVILALIAFIALAGVAIHALLRLTETARSLRRLADDVDARLPVLLEDADVAVQAVSLELMRLDDILTNVEEVSDRVGETTRAASEAVHVPLQKVAEYAEKARRFVVAMRER